MAKGPYKRTRVKLCGITRLEDALMAVSCGVDALGFIFFADSPRYISPKKVAKIIKELPPFVTTVGVFVDAPLEDVVAVADGLSLLQLHGRESVQYCLDIQDSLSHCGIIKAFRSVAGSCAEDFSAYVDCVDFFLLDTYVKGGYGGTGEVFDWSIIDGLKLQRPLLLAGGLSPINIVNAIEQVRPFAVDINSGVELSPGVKEHARVIELMRLVTRM